jgi:hypothetical protein
MDYGLWIMGYVGARRCLALPGFIHGELCSNGCNILINTYKPSFPQAERVGNLSEK